MSRQKTRTLAEIPWLSLLPPEQRAGLEPSYVDPDAEQWDALVAADRSLEDDFARPGSVARVVKPLAAAGVIAVMLLAVDAPSVAEQRSGGGGSSATDSGTVKASGAALPRTVPEENRVALASASPLEVAGAEASGSQGKPRAGGGGAPATPSTPAPPPAATEPEPPPLVSTTLPVVGDVEVPAPKVELPGVELPQLPPLQLPQLPQLPPLLPPSRQQ